MKTHEQFDSELKYQIENHFGKDWSISPTTIISNYRNDDTIEVSLVLINTNETHKPKTGQFIIDFKSHISPQDQLTENLKHSLK
jgi:hypothetical protein